MKNNIGIWINTRHAYLINVSNSKESFKKIESNIETRVRFKGESKKFGRFGGQYMTYEKNKLNRKNEQTNQFMKTILEEIPEDSSIVIFGPSRMKNILKKEINKNSHIKVKLIAVENSKFLTENQIVAWVKNYFTKLAI